MPAPKDPKESTPDTVSQGKIESPATPPPTEEERKDTPSAAGPPPPENTTPEQVVAPADWQAATQPEKPFETDADRAVAERTKPEDLEFTTPLPPEPPEKK